MLLLSSNIEHKHSHFERGRSRSPIRVKLLRVLVCTDNNRFTTLAHHARVRRI